MPKKHLHPEHLNHLHDAIFERVLGKGSSGVVRLYKCCESGNCTECFVIKKFNRPFSIIRYLTGLKKNGRLLTSENENIKDTILKKLVQEYRIGLLLNHKNIIRTLDVDLNKYCIIFEYCPGSDLFEVLQKNNLSILEKIDCFKQIVDGVEYLHKSGVAHLDIKLENILFDRENNCAKLFDFGKSFIFKNSETGESFKVSGIQGTINYMSPEEFTQPDFCPDKADVWAVGILLYVLLFQRYPWSSATSKDLSYNYHLKCMNDNRGLTNYIFPINTLDLSARNQKFINKMFSKILCHDPEKRATIGEISVLFANF
jgi:serine/threonine protein kinase